jgi:hypothetical protein
MAMKPVWIKKGKGYVRIPYGVLTEGADGTWRILVPKPNDKDHRKISYWSVAIKFLEEHKEHFEFAGHYHNYEVWKPKEPK